MHILHRFYTVHNKCTIGIMWNQIQLQAYLAYCAYVTYNPLQAIDTICKYFQEYAKQDCSEKPRERICAPYGPTKCGVKFLNLKQIASGT